MADGIEHGKDLEDLDDRIDEAKDKADDAEHPLIDDDGPRYHESGSIREDLVDETIVPPG